MRYLLAIAMALIPSFAFAQMVNPQLVRPQIMNGLTGGNGMQVACVAGCTTAASAGAVCPVTITWPTPLLDTSYQTFCTCMGTATGTPVISNQGAQSATSIAINTMAVTAVASSCPSVCCVAIHQ